MAHSPGNGQGVNCIRLVLQLLLIGLLGPARLGVFIRGGGGSLNSDFFTAAVLSFWQELLASAFGARAQVPGERLLDSTGRRLGRPLSRSPGWASGRQTCPWDVGMLQRTNLFQRNIHQLLRLLSIFCPVLVDLLHKELRNRTQRGTPHTRCGVGVGCVSTMVRVRRRVGKARMLVGRSSRTTVRVGITILPGILVFLFKEGLHVQLRMVRNHRHLLHCVEHILRNIHLGNRYVIVNGYLLVDNCPPPHGPATNLLCTQPGESYCALLCQPQKSSASCVQTCP